ncbi:hypothetical protein [Entomobacter blattae]|uniref:Uncharacterized protein n=1 Tax=Entomobacter blattae TaxID=2762277 RepID=A0A7H1NTL4_9PROT|nr:hypothetical protein [Entomobacter blattae]QNT79124.1 hypothetical protein JGUZn3_19100 [Entomobacter blattae]
MNNQEPADRQTSLSVFQRILLLVGFVITSLVVLGMGLIKAIVNFVKGKP